VNTQTGRDLLSKRQQLHNGNDKLAEGRKGLHCQEEEQDSVISDPVVPRLGEVVLEIGPTDVFRHDEGRSSQ
jgi:hypothetical protein